MDRIEKQAVLAAPVERVWQALSDHEQFGAWFGVKLEGPFEAGKPSRGAITHPGYEHVKWQATVREVAPGKRLSYTWHPYALDPARDYSQEAPTLVEFTLAPHAQGTLLTVVESGFDALPADRREEAYRMNEGGWAAQIEHIAGYLARHP